MRTSAARQMTEQRTFDFLHNCIVSPRFGLLKLFATVFTGVSIGAWISKKMAAFLEENELFVPDDDDDDDD